MIHDRIGPILILEVDGELPPRKEPLFMLQFLETRVHIIEPTIHTIKSLIHLLEPSVDVLEPLFDMFEPLVNMFEPFFDTRESCVHRIDDVVQGWLSCCIVGLCAHILTP